jgi:uncharacterized membrane protein
MPMENQAIMAFARTLLRERWGVAAATFLVYLVITCSLSVIPVLGWIGGLIIGGPLLIGLSIFSLAIARGKNAKASQLFDCFPFFVNGLIAYILVTIYVLLWSLLLIVPGIIAAFSYSMTFFLLADNPQLDGQEAMKHSKAMMDGHKWELSCLVGRFTGWFLVGIFTLGIGFLWIGPYFMASVAKFYDDIRIGEQSVQQ